MAMFSKAARNDTVPAAASAAEHNRGMPTIVAEDMAIQGELAGPDEIQVEGHVEGTIQCAVLVVGPNGSVEGKVKAGEVRIAGRFQGEVKADSVAMTATAQVQGDIEVRDALSIEMGAVFDGHTRRAKAASVTRIEAAKPAEIAKAAASA